MGAVVNFSGDQQAQRQSGGGDGQINRIAGENPTTRQARLPVGRLVVHQIVETGRHDHGASVGVSKAVSGGEHQCLEDAHVDQYTQRSDNQKRDERKRKYSSGYFKKKFSTTSN